MSDLHSIGARGLDQEATRKKMEAIHPQFVKEGLLRAREKSWQAFQQIRAQIKAGLTEEEGRNIALQVLKDMGSPRNWHQPYVRFGPGTVLTFHDNLQKDYKLQSGDPVYMDLGPVWLDKETGLEYEGDVGDTFVFGKNPEAEKCAAIARNLFLEGQIYWRDNKKPSGEEMYKFLKKRISELGYVMVEKVDGHRISDYPHAKYAKERLGEVPFHPSAYLWILEFQITHPTLKIGAFFEDILQ